MKRIILVFALVAVLVAGYAGSQRIEQKPHSAMVDDDVWMRQASGVYDSTLFYLDHTYVGGTSTPDTAYSMIYYSFPYNLIMPIHEQVETDSTAYRVIVETGVYNPYTGAYVFAPSDSISVTSATQPLSEAISVPGGEVFRILLRSVSGSAMSQATQIRLWYRRHR